MKYIKTFENYKVNENEVNPISSEINLTKAESVIKQKVESFTEEEKNKAIKELTTLAGELKLSLADMTDAAKVEAALSKLRAHISPQRFIEAVQRGVEQRLLEQSGFPDLDKWSRDKDKH